MARVTRSSASLARREKLLAWAHERGWDQIAELARELRSSLENGGAVFTCGNGGSASQAEHFAAELAGRFKLDRRSLPVFALSTNTASVTAIANDFGFTEMFARQIQGIGKTGDCLVALSTSGESKNIIRACEIARQKGMKVFALTGRSGGALRGVSNRLIRVPDTDTARIQEAHLLVLHIACQMIEDAMFTSKRSGSPGT